MGEYKIKYCHGFVPPIQQGFFKHRLLNIGTILAKFSMLVGIKWPCHYSKFLVSQNHGNSKWAGFKILIVHLASIIHGCKIIDN